MEQQFYSSGNSLAVFVQQIFAIADDLQILKHVLLSVVTADEVLLVELVTAEEADEHCLNARELVLFQVLAGLTVFVSVTSLPRMP